MPKHLPPYPAALSCRPIRRNLGLRRSGSHAPAGKPHAEIARALGMTGATLRLWLIKQADVDEGQRSDGLTSDEHEDLRRLRREHRLVREERALLKTAAACCAQETTSLR